LATRHHGRPNPSPPRCLKYGHAWMCRRHPTFGSLLGRANSWVSPWEGFFCVLVSWSTRICLWDDRRILNPLASQSAVSRTAVPPLRIRNACVVDVCRRFSFFFAFFGFASLIVFLFFFFFFWCTIRFALASLSRFVIAAREGKPKILMR